MQVIRPAFFIFIYMSENRIVNIEWLTDRWDDDVLKIVRNMELDILSSQLSIFGSDELDKVVGSSKNVKYVNSIIRESSGAKSKLSIGATMALLSRPTAPFVIPPDLIEYIHQNIQSQETLDRYKKNFPNSDDVWDKGREFYNIFIDMGFPTQSAYMLAAAVFIECRWIPQVYNREEQKGGGVNGTGGWTGCGEGSFGLTFWRQKKKIIESLNLHTRLIPVYSFDWMKKRIDYGTEYNVIIPNDEKHYEPATFFKHKYGCLFQCKNDIWVEIIKAFIDGLGKAAGDDKTCIEYIMYSEPPLGASDPNDDDHKLLYSCYLFKAGAGTKKEFEPCAKCAERYMTTHQRMYSVNNPSYQAKNNFVEQLLVAYLLSLYVTDTEEEKFNLDEIIKF